MALKDFIFSRWRTIHYQKRFLQKFSANRRGTNFWLHCKYSLIKYKPWQESQLSLLGVDENNNAIEDTTDAWVDAWTEFLKTPKADNVIPKHVKQIEDAQALIDLGLEDDGLELNEVAEEEEETSNERQAEWMGLAQFNGDDQDPTAQFDPDNFIENHSIEY